MTSPTFLQLGGTKTSANASATMGGVNVGAGANKIGLYWIAIKASSASTSPFLTGVTYNSNPGPGTAMTKIGSYQVKSAAGGDDNTPTTLECWAVLLGSSTLVSGQILPAFDVSSTPTGDSAAFVVFQDCEQNLANIQAAWTAMTPAFNDVDNTNSPSVAQTTLVANALIVSAAGWATNASLAVPAATAVNSDVKRGDADLASRCGIAVYDFATTTTTTHTFATTFTNNWARIRVAGVILNPVPSNSITVTDFGSGQVHQRSPSWTGANATVRFSGTYTGTAPDDIKVKVSQGAGTIVALTSLSSQSIGAGVWSGTLSVPKGGGISSGYTIGACQSMLSGGLLAGPVTGTASWGVGDIIFFAGSSSGQKMETDGAAGAGGLTPNAQLGMFSSTGFWITPAGDGLITIGNGFMGLNDGSPICIYNYAIGGSTLANWSGTVTVIDSANPIVDGYWTAMIAIGAHALRIDIGTNSNDIRKNTIGSVANGTQAQCDALWATYLARIDSNFGASTPMIHTVTQRMEIGSPGALPGSEGTANQRTWGVASELNAIDGRPHTWYVQSVDYSLRSDNIHILESDMVRLGQRIVDIAHTRLFSGTNPALAPQPASASRSGNSIILAYTLNGATGLVNGLNNGTFTVPVSCFEVQDSGGAVQTINTATITSPTEITLALASTPAAGWKVFALPHANPSLAVYPGIPNVPAAKA